MSELEFRQDKELTQQTQAAFKVEIKKDKCKGCRLCILYCPTNHLKLSPQFNKKGRQFVEPAPTTGCIGCGFCFYMCPDACIKISSK